MVPFLALFDSVLRFGAFLFVLYTLVLWFSAIVWVYRDVRNRTTDSTSHLVAVLLVAVLNFPGLIVYLVIRPQATIADAYERSLEAEAILHELQLTTNSCQNCRRPIEDDFNVCPHCKTVLREACRTCGRPVRTSWTACAYCAADRPQPRTQPAAGSVTTAPLAPPRRSTINLEGTGPSAQGPVASRPPVPGQG